MVSEPLGPRRIIVGSLYGSTNQRSAVTCKGTFPFPFQAEGQIIESEVKTCMQEINFFCRKCKKSLKLSYIPCGNNDTQVMNSMIIRCHTNRCTRVVTLKNFTEGRMIEKTDASGKCYL